MQPCTSYVCILVISYLLHYEYRYSIYSRCIILNCIHIIFSTHTISRVLLLPYCIVLCIAKKSCVMVYTSGGTMLQNLTLGKQVTRALKPVYLPQGLERLVCGGESAHCRGGTLA